MPRHGLLVGIPLAVALTGCAGSEPEWMKVGERYTVEEFQRDVKACTRGGKLDHDCMRGRGWVAVSPAKVEKRPDAFPVKPGTQYRR